MDFSLINSDNVINLFLDGKRIDEVLSPRFLGVTIDCNLNWHDHIDNLASKLASGLFIIRKVAKLAHKKLSSKCYYAFIYSHIKYSILS